MVASGGSGVAGSADFDVAPLSPLLLVVGLREESEGELS